MDAAATQDERRQSGRRSRVVLTPRRWCQVGDDASHHADDGGKRARSPGSARNKPYTIARGMPVDSGVTVTTCVRATLIFARKAAGASGARHSLRPLIGEGGKFRINLAQNMRRDREGVF